MRLLATSLFLLYAGILLLFATLLPQPEHAQPQVTTPSTSSSVSPVSGNRAAPLLLVNAP